jgi:hypothetical protein
MYQAKKSDMVKSILNGIQHTRDSILKILQETKMEYKALMLTSGDEHHKEFLLKKIKDLTDNADYWKQTYDLALSSFLVHMDKY